MSDLSSQEHIKAQADMRAWYTDQLVILGSYSMAAFIIYGLIYTHPEASVVPVLASFVTALVALPAAYSAYRWGNSVGAKNAAEAASDNNKVIAAGLVAASNSAPATPPPPPPSEVADAQINVAGDVNVKATS